MVWVHNAVQEAPKATGAGGLGAIAGLLAALRARLGRDAADAAGAVAPLSAPQAFAPLPDLAGADQLFEASLARQKARHRLQGPAFRRDFKSAEGVSPAQGGSSPSPAQADAFHTGDQPKMHALDGEIIFLTVMGASPAMRPCLDWLSGHVSGLVSAKGFAADDPVWTAPRSSYLLIDLEAMGGIAGIALDLMALRHKRPDLIVILLSAEFERHDYSQERLALCDVSLRYPCTFAALELALVEAEINNWAWYERLAELEHA